MNPNDLTNMENISRLAGLSNAQTSPTVSEGGLSIERRKLLNDFIDEIRAILVAGHQEYGETAEEMYKTLGNASVGYAICEKGIRYGRKGNPKDLVKAASYAFLGWMVAKK